MHLFCSQSRGNMDNLTNYPLLLTIYYRIINGSKIEKSASDSGAASQTTSVLPHLPLCLWNASFATSQVARSYPPATSLEHTYSWRVSKSNSVVAFGRSFPCLTPYPRRFHLEWTILKLPPIQEQHNPTFEGLDVPPLKKNLVDHMTSNIEGRDNLMESITASQSASGGIMRGESSK